MTDEAGKAHTKLEDGHPALETDGADDRTVGGPRLAEDAPENAGEPGAKGDIKTRGFEDDPHE